MAPISDQTHEDMRLYTQTLSVEERRDMSATQSLTGVNESMRDEDKRMSKAPMAKILTGLLFVSHAELTFDQRISLTSIMAHRGIDLTGLDASTLRPSEICSSRCFSSKKSCRQSAPQQSRPWRKKELDRHR